MAKRQTREEKAAEVYAIRRREKIDTFMKQLAAQRALIVYRHAEAFAFPVGTIAYTLSSDDLATRRAQCGALWELVHEFNRVRDDQKRNLERLMRRAEESLARQAEGRIGSGYSTMLGDLPADIEQAEGKVTALCSAIAQFAHATGWYVPDINPEARRVARALLLGIEVEQHGEGFVVRSMRDGKTFYLGRTERGGFDFVVDDALTLPQIVVYDNEDAAWFAAATFADDRRYL